MAPVRLDPVNIADDISLPLRLAPAKLAPDKLAPAKVDLDKLASERSA